MGQYLTFKINEENFGIDISDVIEIIGMQKITQIPEQPDYVQGLINLRGNIIPTIDIKTRFHKQKADYDQRTCIIVVDTDSLVVGFIVDRVHEVITIEDSNITDLPRFNQDFQGKYVKGIAKVNEDIVMLLESKLLLSAEELLETEQLLA